MTRPEAQAGVLVEALKQRNFEPVAMPLLALQAQPLTSKQRSLLLDLDQFSQVLFVSRNAVRFGMAAIEDFWPQLPMGLQWYGVGAGTAASLREFGLAAYSPGGEMSSEDLLQLPGLQAVAGQRLLIVKGEGGRDTLRSTLIERGARVEELHCYRRLRPRYTQQEVAERLFSPPIALLMISSGEGFANLLALLSPAETTKLHPVPLLVPSRRVAGLAGEAGFADILLANNASDAAMLRAVEEWSQRHGDSE